MKHYVVVTCTYCGSEDLVKNGHRNDGTQRWHCNKCKKYFQFDFRYNASKQGVKEQIIELTMNSSGVRDIARTLQINKNTVVAVLKKNALSQPIYN